MVVSKSSQKRLFGEENPENLFASYFWMVFSTKRYLQVPKQDDRSSPGHRWFALISDGGWKIYIKPSNYMAITLEQRHHEVESRYRQTSWSAEQDAKCLQNWLGGLWPFFFLGRFEAIVWERVISGIDLSFFPLILTWASLDAGETCKLGEQIQ